MPTLTLNDLNQFCGTENWYRHLTGILYTDGVKFLAEEAGAFWLIDEIGHHQKEFGHVPFQLWNLRLSQEHEAFLTMREDSDAPALVCKKIHYTTFPLKEIDLYFINNVLHLPTEY